MPTVTVPPRKRHRRRGERRPSREARSSPWPVRFDCPAGLPAGRAAGGLATDQPGSSAASPQAAEPQAAVPADGPRPPAPVSRSDRVPVLAWVIGAVFVAVELAVSGRYGFQQDELYFIVAGHHLAFGYVDQPPLAPLLTRVTDIFGVSPTAIRIAPALAGGAVVVLAARLAALFGAGRACWVLAALMTACTPVLLGAVHIANTTSLSLLDLDGGPGMRHHGTAAAPAARVAGRRRRGGHRARERQPADRAADRTRPRHPGLAAPSSCRQDGRGSGRASPRLSGRPTSSGRPRTVGRS